MEPQNVIQALLEEIAGRYSQNLTEDDVTLLLVRANGQAPRYWFREKLDASARFFKALVMAIDSKGERPPLPDFILANIGGAIIPALGRRWKASKQ
jgi:hypothetical protein